MSVDPGIRKGSGIVTMLLLLHNLTCDIIVRLLRSVARSIQARHNSRAIAKMFIAK
jgi:hypothetical protein